MNCRVCGRQFDPQGFQVMVPGLKHGFDRVDCALEASAHSLPPARSIEPTPAVLRALPTALVPVPALAAGPVAMAGRQSARPHFLAGANLALLAAGTAATIYLWLRVFGADAGPISFPAANASDPFGRTTVAAAIDLSPESQIRPEPENTVRGVTPPVTAPPAAPSASSGGGGGTLVSNPPPRKEPRSRRNGGPVVRPAPPAPPPAPPAEPGPTRSAPVPTHPVPSSPPDDRVPGPTLPGGANPEQPALPDGGRP